MGVGVHRLRLGGGPEKPCRLLESFQLGLLREGEVLAVGLRFACKGVFEVLFRL